MPDFNLKSTTIEKSLDLLKDFLGKAIGPTVEELGGMWGDSMRIRRFGNALKCLERAKAKAEKAGISIKQINLKALNPLLEGMSLEEDETLQEMWANLFVNYIDSEKKLRMHIFPDILKHLSSSEVMLLQRFKENDQGALAPSKGIVRNDQALVVIDGKEIPQSEFDNLERLGLIVINDMGMIGAESFEREFNYAAAGYGLKELGHDFINACKRAES